MSGKRSLWGFLLILIIALSACTGQTDVLGTESAEVSVVDDRGRTIVLETVPERIVSLAPSITESLFAIGAGDLIVARDDYSVNPPEAVDLPSLALTPDNIPTEAVLAFEPDLVVVAEILNPETIRELEEMGVPVYWMENPETFTGLYNNLIDLAALTGHQEDTRTLIASLEDRVEAVDEKVSQAQVTPKVFYELDATDPQNPWTAGADTFVNFVIEQAGGENIGTVVGGEWVQISAEEIIAQNPDVILLADAEWGVSPEMVAERPGWGQIAAVQKDRVVPFDSNLLSVPGPRLVDGYETVAEILHPELFE